MQIKSSIPNSWAEPWKIKTVEHIRLPDRSARENALEDAGWNTFLLKSEDVFIDLLTDSGTNAMSDRQWAAIMTGDEAYAGSKDYYKLEEVVRRVYGFKHLIPTHQGRGAEHLLSQLLISNGDVVPGNMYFTTTKFHQEHAGGTFVDVIIDEAQDPTSEHPFKGNIDLNKLSAVIDEHGADKIPYISYETNVNMAGGQPVSLENIREVHSICKQHGIKLMLDATRAVENSYFIKCREAGYQDKTIAEILGEICSYMDGCTMSGKKDGIVNIGGFLAVNDDHLAQQARNMVVAFEGLHTYGGMAGRDMAALAVGIEESIEYDYIYARVEQVRYLGKKLAEFGVPLVVPFGGHAIYLDINRILPHVPQTQFPAQRFAGELYLEGGIRSMERGAVSAGRDKQGNHIFPSLELVRLTIPRRVYTQSHLDVVSESVARVCQRADSIGGLEMIYEPSHLRFFQARFSPI
ncbi:MAG: tyrosine phenol-lyase [Bdellovibrionales bacterium]|nr:tyrosine phenol-lyase [Bdellovibrionales bacterium]